MIDAALTGREGARRVGSGGGLEIQPFEAVQDGAIPEVVDGDAVVWLIEEGQRGVIYQHNSRKVSAQQGEILHTGMYPSRH